MKQWKGIEMTKETQWGPFIAFSGGECPVDRGVQIILYTDNLTKREVFTSIRVAAEISWASPNIIGYRVEVKPKKGKFFYSLVHGNIQGGNSGIPGNINYEATLEELEQFRV